MQRATRLLLCAVFLIAACATEAKTESFRLVKSATRTTPRPPAIREPRKPQAPRIAPSRLPKPVQATTAPNPVIAAPQAGAGQPIRCHKRGSRLAGGPNVDLGKRMAAERGWTGGEWQALWHLWSCESSWNSRARGGIPQFRPDRGAHNWAPERQIREGMNYIAGRPSYRVPSRALAHFQSRNWY